ncbi:hypothetical protein [Rhizobium leguminosarum]|jgi:hypothetical protein|uniref:hypothetical protein n=1 Tax=Rhizobium leguminosarum TaxID=384 RepID=UPI002E163CF3|nr:hypothetical protein U8Q02_41955 [Rhizobium leguminosarum]
MNTTGKQKPRANSIDTLAAVIGTCALVMFAIWLSTVVGGFLTMVVGAAFFISGKQHRLFDLIARPLRRVMGVRADGDGEEAGFRRGAFKSRPALPPVIDHDPNEFTRKRG